jgi:hypothetical protein
MALDRTIDTMIPDDKGVYIPFEYAGNDPWGLPLGGEHVKGLYVQTFNQRKALLLLPDAPGLPLHVRFVASPFLDILLFPERYSVRGTANLRVLDVQSREGDGFMSRLVQGLALYGLPLSDPLPRRIDQDSPWQEAQRFSRGWLLSEEFIPAEETGVSP